MATLKPLLNRIVIKQIETEQLKSSVLVIVDSNKEPPTQGTVVAVGPGRYDKGMLVPMTVKVGDRILYPKNTGTDVKVSGEAFRVMFEDDVIAVINQ